MLLILNECKVISNVGDTSFELSWLFLFFNLFCANKWQYVLRAVLVLFLLHFFAMFQSWYIFLLFALFLSRAVLHYFFSKIFWLIMRYLFLEYCYVFNLKPSSYDHNKDLGLKDKNFDDMYFTHFILNFKFCLFQIVNNKKV